MFGWAALTLVGNNLQMVSVVDRRMHANRYLINNYNIGNFEACFSYKSLFNNYIYVHGRILPQPNCPHLSLTVDFSKKYSLKCHLPKKRWKFSMWIFNKYFFKFIFALTINCFAKYHCTMDYFEMEMKKKIVLLVFLILNNNRH